MNKNAIQRFAIWARTELISQVSQRAYQYNITADGYGDYNAEAVAGRLLTKDEKKQRQQLINQIRSKGYTQVMEEIAYTWFNRFIALRFMEVNNYLPTHIRVFSDASGAFKPEILSNALHLDLGGLDMEKVSDLIEKNQSEDLYRYLLLTQCNALSASLPRMFENMGSYTELLLPNNILRQDSVLGRMVTDIPEEDWTDQVQIIGWLYQYYNTELKDDTFALLKKNVKITKERIPSATQLFTPDWIVRYMVENSLGRLWIEGHPDHELKAGWKYYLDEAEQEADVQAQLEAVRAEYRTLRPQEIKVIDPCMGSGHILVYAFDVLVQIYKKAGFSERDAAQSILENNLYGLDIDDRAAQLAYFAVMMKARQYDRRIFTRKIQPHIFTIIESNDIRIPAKWRLGPEQDIAEKLVVELKDAKEYGSILNLSLTQDELVALRKRLMEIDEMSCEGNLMDMMESAEIFDGLFPLVEVAEVLTQQYDVVITNPPYMGAGNMAAKLSEFVKSSYPDSKSDLSTVFMEKALSFSKSGGYMAMINIPVWMFLSSYEMLREKLINNNTFISMVHPGRGIFGSDFGTTTFVLGKRHIPDYIGCYRRLFDKQGEVESIEVREQRFFEGKGKYTAKQSNFSKIPGWPVAYWVSERFLRMFDFPSFYDMSISDGKNVTGNNDKFLRMIWEVAAPDVGVGKHYLKYLKGGEYRKWYGNIDYVIDWSDSARFHYRSDKVGRIIPEYLWYKKGISWTLLTSGAPSFRYKPEDSTFDSGGLTIFLKNEENINYYMGMFNSVVFRKIQEVINPTINLLIKDIRSVPMPVDYEKKPVIERLVLNNISIAKTDWDSFETSWDFETHPIVKKALSRFHWGHEGSIALEYVYKYVAQDFEERFKELKSNEEELNHLFIKIYGLEDELVPDVQDKDVSVRRADLGRDIRSMISYAVGCMFGRYSLDVDGLAYAGGQWDASKYVTFQPDQDAIIPICDDEYFDDDITGHFVKWVEIVYGKQTLEENLEFIADALGGKGSPRQIIRRYFINDFYKDHCKIYQKRPIYWLFDSGKKNGFKALIYMHRYQSDLLARMRTDYVHEQQERYRTQLKHIGDAMDSASASERVKLAKQQKKFQEQALELQKYEEKVHHLADQNIKIDLDDGVKHNYGLFADVLAKIK